MFYNIEMCTVLLFLCMKKHMSVVSVCAEKKPDVCTNSREQVFLHLVGVFSGTRNEVVKGLKPVQTCINE